jgi:polysaccharide export outer membrane protein
MASPIAARAPRRDLFRAVVMLTAMVIAMAPVCAADGGASEMGAETSAADGEQGYRIGASDTLAVEVRNQPRVSGSYAVRPDGAITLPLVGDVRAVGMRPEKLADRLERRLGTYIREPVVTVTVTAATGTFASRVRIIGSGVPPVSLPYRRGMTALDAILGAYNGLPDTAAGNRAYLLRRADEDDARRRVELRLADLVARPGDVANPRLRRGDVMVVPEGFFAGDWQFDQFVSARQTYTDNIDLDPDGEKEAALITEIGPAISFRGNMARVQAALNGSLSYERTSLNQAGNDLNADVRGSGQVEWVENTLFTDAAASVSQQVLDSASAASASGVNNANQELVQTYRVSPYVVNRLGRFARMETRYTGAATLISGDDRDNRRFDRGDDDDASDSIQHTVSLTVSSGPSFDRWSWSLRGSASELNFLGDEGDPGPMQQNNTDSDQSRRDVVLQNRFALTRRFALTGDIGYQKLDSDDARDSFESIRWAAGFRYTPSPDTLLAANAGEVDDDRSFQVEARHDISPRSTVSLTYREEVATGQERLVARLPEDIDDVEEIAFEDIRFSLRDEVTRTETLRARFSTAFGRNSVDLTGTYATEAEDAVDGDTTEERIGIGVRYGRPLTRELDLNLDASYQNVRFDDVDAGQGLQDVEDDDYRAGVGVDYTGFERLSLGLRYSFTKRVSSRAADEFTENAVTLSGRYRF